MAATSAQPAEQDEDGPGLGEDGTQRGELTEGDELVPGRGEVEELVLAPVRVSLPTKVLGLCWYGLAWLLVPEGPIANGLLALCCGLWVGSELCRLRRFAAQEWMLRDVVSQLKLSACFVSRVRTDNLVQLQQLTKDVVASTTQTPSRCFLESLVVMCALWLSSILLGMLWESFMAVLVNALFAFLSSVYGSEWLRQTARFTDDAEVLKLIDQLVTLDQALAVERKSNPTAYMLAEQRWRSKWSFDALNWRDSMSAIIGELWFVQDAGEEILNGVACFAVAQLLWWLLRRSTRRRLEHRLIMTKAGCVDLLINIISTDQPPAAPAAAASTAAREMPGAAPALEHAERLGRGREDELYNEVDRENPEAGVDREDREADVLAGGGGREEGAGTQGNGNADDDDNEEESAPANAAPRLNAHSRDADDSGNVSHLAAGCLALIAATSDAASAGPGLLQVEAVQRILVRMATPWCDGTTLENLTAALQEVLAGRQPGVVLLAAVKVMHRPAYTWVEPDEPDRRLQPSGENEGVQDDAQQTGEAVAEASEGHGGCFTQDHSPGQTVVPEYGDDQVLMHLKCLLNVLPKQCSSRVRQAVSHTGLVGVLLQIIWGDSDRAFVLRRIRTSHASSCSSARGKSSKTGGTRHADAAQHAVSAAGGNRRRAWAAGRGGAQVVGPVAAGGGARQAGDAEMQSARRRAEILASNIVVRLATQLEWEDTEKTPVLDEVTARLCSEILEDPSSKNAENAAVLLAVIANAMVNSMAHTRLYEPSAETMPLRLEQVRLDLKKLRSEPSLVLPRAQTLLQGKMMHFGMCTVPCLSRLLVSHASYSAKAAAALCIAIIALLRPAVVVPHAALESMVALLDAEDATAVFAVEALAALTHVSGTQSYFDEQGVVEMAVRLARRRGSSESQACAANFLELLATRRRLYRGRCRQAGAVEVLRHMQENGNASVREAAGAALTAVSRTVFEDVSAVCSSTGYLLLVIFCFFVQLGGVHAVMDVMEVVGDIAHLLSRITSVRRRLPSPSAASIALDFLINDPAAFLLMALLLAVLPGLGIYLYMSHYVCNETMPLLVPGNRAADDPTAQRHRSWLLGLTVRQEVQQHDDTEHSVRRHANLLRRLWWACRRVMRKTVIPQTCRASCKYFVTEAMADGPCKHSVREGDQLLSIDGRDVSEMSLHEFIIEARGRPRCTLAQSLSNRLDPLRRLLGIKVVPRSGRGSRAHLKIMHFKKDGRRKTKDLWVVRGNWMGVFDNSHENGGDDRSAGGADDAGDSDRLGFLTWLRELRKSPEHETDGNRGQDRAVVASQDEEDEQVCRICQCSEEEAPDYGKLFSPCLCRGTMRYIHHACLDKWRKLSANAASNTQCDQCFYVYRVERRGLAKFLRVRWVLEVASVLLLLVAVILAGFIVKWGRLALDLPLSVGAMAEAGEKAEAATVAAERVLLSTWSGVGVVAGSQQWQDVCHHLLLGCTGVGILGFSTLVILLPMRGLGFIGYHPNLLRGTGGKGRGDPSASIVLGIVVVAGLMRALHLSYKLVLHVSGIIAERSGTVILPADLSHSSGSRVSKPVNNRFRF